MPKVISKRANLVAIIFIESMNPGICVVGAKIVLIILDT